MTNKDLVQAFAYGENAKNKSMHTDGVKLYSYNTVIAQRDGRDIIINTSYYSVTSSAHKNLIYKVVGTDYKEVQGVPVGCCDLMPYVN